MSLTRLFRALALALAPFLAAAGLALPARAGGDCCGPGICCPKTTFCRIRPPCIKWKCTCPKPICDPCNLEHYGYYPTCWHCWPFPPDYGCCKNPTNGAIADQILGQPEPVVSNTPTTPELPVPRKLNGGVPNLGN